MPSARRTATRPDRPRSSRGSPACSGGPRPTPSGGVGKRLGRRRGLPIPAWVRAGSRSLATALLAPDERALRDHRLCVGPVASRTRLIFTGPDPLQRARFPYRRGVIAMPPEHPRGTPR